VKETKRGRSKREDKENNRSIDVSKGVKDLE